MIILSDETFLDLPRTWTVVPTRLRWMEKFAVESAAFGVPLDMTGVRAAVRRTRGGGTEWGIRIPGHPEPVRLWGEIPDAASIRRVLIETFRPRFSSFSIGDTGSDRKFGLTFDSGLRDFILRLDAIAYAATGECSLTVDFRGMSAEQALIAGFILARWPQIAWKFGGTSLVDNSFSNDWYTASQQSHRWIQSALAGPWELRHRSTPRLSYAQTGVYDLNWAWMGSSSLCARLEQVYAARARAAAGDDDANYSIRVGYPPGFAAAVGAVWNVGVKTRVIEQRGALVCTLERNKITLPDGWSNNC